MRLFLLILLAFPFIEIALLVWLGQLIGLWTLVWLASSTLLGLWMLRNQRVGALLTEFSAMQGQHISLYQLLWPVRFLLAGVLFVWPGVISDFIALLLLLPIRGPALNTQNPPPFTQAEPDSGVIEGEFTRINEAPLPPAQPIDKNQP